MRFYAQFTYDMSSVVLQIYAHRLDRAGYDSVFMVALALIGVDVVLRLLMIEPTTKPHVKSLEGETEPLLRDAASTDYQSRSLDQRPDLDVEGSPRPNTQSRIPPIIRLAMSGQLLIIVNCKRR